MPDYSKCIIYTIRTPTGLYVGSTCNFVNRKYNHKSDIHNKNGKAYNRNLYKNIRENNDEWVMKPYSQFPCKNKMEMNIEEERIRRELNANLNTFCCHTTKEERVERDKQKYQRNKEQIIERSKQYYIANKEKVDGYKKRYREKKKKSNKHIKLLEEKQKINTDA